MADDAGLAFDAVPEIYDRIRPTYPDALFDELFSHFREPPVRIVEIGPGTGKATISLLARGSHVIAVEPGPRMARFLRRKFADEERLEVINARFEEAGLQGPVDIVFAATSFHWVDPRVRLSKAHQVLRPGSAIAVVSTNQIASEADHGYFARSQAVYKRYFPDEGVPQLPGEDVIPAEFSEVADCGFFGVPELNRYRWDRTYSTADYADLLRSYSNMQMMPENDREALIAELCTLAETSSAGP